MATKIRLQRQGRKSRAIYHIVVADSRSKRDGKFIERLGLYNPNIDPAKVELNFESAVKWVGTGSEISDTARSILSKEGVLLRNHLDGGVKKGALSQEDADKKFDSWQKEKVSKVDAAAKVSAQADAKLKSEALAAETKVKEDREAIAAAKIAEEQASLVPEVEAAERAVEAEKVEEVVEETSEEASENTAE
jgi:small subunit ribosomal protein S16